MREAWARPDGVVKADEMTQIRFCLACTSFNSGHMLVTNERRHGCKLTEETHKLEA